MLKNLLKRVQENKKDVLFVREGRQKKYDSRIKLLNKITNYSIYTLVFLLPLIFIPNIPLDINQIKLSLLISTITIGSISFTLSLIYGGRNKMVSRNILITTFAISFLIFLSSFFTSSYKDGLIGVGVETDSWYIISLLLLAIILTASVINTKEKVFKLFSALWISFGISSIIQLIILISSSNSKTINTVGTWGDFGIMAGIVAISIAITLDVVPLNKKMKNILWTIFGLSTLMSVIAASSMITYGGIQATGVPYAFISSASIIGIVALLFAVSQLIKKYKQGSEIKFPTANMILVFIGIIFLAAPISVNKQIDGVLNIPEVSMVNIKPDFDETYYITQSVLSSSIKNSLIGYGTHGFYIARNIFRQDTVNKTSIWNEDFQFGYGYIPTILVNNGLITVIIILVSLMLLFLFAIKKILLNKKDESVIYTQKILIITSLILWINIIFNSSGVTLLILTSVVTGLLIGDVKEFSISDCRYKKMTIIGIFLFIILLVCLSFVWSERNKALMYSSEATMMINSKDTNITVVPKALNLLQKSFDIYPSDVYARAINNLALVQVNYDVSSEELSNGKVLLSSSTSAYLDVAISSGKASVVGNPMDFRNWLQYASTMQTVALLTTGEDGKAAANLSVQGFGQSIDLANNHPLPFYSLASLYALAGERDYAKNILEKALTMKPDFVEASDLYQSLMVNTVSSATDTNPVDEATTTVSTKKIIKKPLKK